MIEIEFTKIHSPREGSHACTDQCRELPVAQPPQPSRAPQTTRERARSDRRFYGLHLNCNDDAPYPSEVTRRPNTQHEERKKRGLSSYAATTQPGKHSAGVFLGCLPA